MFRRETKSVLSCIVVRHGWSGTLQYGTKASFFNTEHGQDEQVELKRNFIEDLFQSDQILSCRVSMVKIRSNDVELGKMPNFCC
jgi:hypothetical protein